MVEGARAMVGGVAIPGGVAVARLEQAVKVLFVENHPLCRAGASVLGSFGPFACAGACPASTTGGGQACGSPRSLCKRRAPQAPALRLINLNGRCYKRAITIHDHRASATVKAGYGLLAPGYEAGFRQFRSRGQVQFSSTFRSPP